MSDDATKTPSDVPQPEGVTAGEQPVTTPSDAAPEQGLEITPELIEKVLSHQEVQNRIYRQAQSMKDRELHRLRQEQEAREQQRKIEQMDDEEYGRWQRQQARLQQATQAAVRETLAQVFTKAQERAVASIEDDDARAEVEEKLAANAFDEFEDFLDAVAEAKAKSKTAKEVAKARKQLEKEIRESLEKERTADEANFAPEFGRGLPAARRKLSGMQSISAGFAEELAKARKGR